MLPETYDNNIDQDIDRQIFECLNLDSPKSFFLFAGAGSGKTRSLVNVLKKLRETSGERLRLSRQKIAVITYTNAACDEIGRRLENNPLFAVSTIHSFAWELIQPYQNDIREWLRVNLQIEIEDLNEKMQKRRPGTKTAIDRKNKLESKSNRFNRLDEIRTFTYDPTGDNVGRASLNHTEVINICSEFLLKKSLMQKILVQQFPILLIDESQDTRKELIDAFFQVQENYHMQFSLGLFGDMMQRIYTDGKQGLGQNLPESWVRPAKKMNHRCPKRVVKLINKIRIYVDDHQQVPRVEKEEGFVRFFIASEGSDTKYVETSVREKMAKITQDVFWQGDQVDVKTLTLEHHMAARRLGFFDLFEPLYKVGRLRNGLLDGKLTELRFFTQEILPIVRANNQGDKFAISRIVTQKSPFFKKEYLLEKKNQLDAITQAKNAVEELLALWKNGNVPSLLEVLIKVSETGLFAIPNRFSSIISIEETQNLNADKKKIEGDDSGQKEDITNAWNQALNASFDQVVALDEYLSDNAKIGTHQGVKGLEFPRVMVIMDDEEAKGFLFSYEKLFNAKEPSETDKKNKAQGKEDSLDRTRRLFYVTCSRAEKSLALVAYTKSPVKVREYLVEEDWFEKGEIEIIQ